MKSKEIAKIFIDKYKDSEYEAIRWLVKLFREDLYKIASSRKTFRTDAVKSIIKELNDKGNAVNRRVSSHFQMQIMTKDWFLMDVEKELPEYFN